MGWNDLQIQQSSALTADLEGQLVYFVHSYYTDVPEEYACDVLDYGRPILAMIHRGRSWPPVSPSSASQVRLALVIRKSLRSMSMKILPAIDNKRRPPSAF